MLWQAFAQSAVPFNSLHLDCITHNSHGTPINLKKTDIFKQRSPFRRTLAARLFHSCTVSVKINFLLTSPTQNYFQQDKNEKNKSSQGIRSMEGEV